MRETFHAMLVLVAILFFGAAEFCSGWNTSFSCIEGEREALLKFKLCFNDLSDMLSSWKGNDCCEWRGIGCDKNSGHVVSLQLRGSIDQPQLYLIDDVEEVVSSLLKLRYLAHLDLSGNNVNSSLIPPSFGLMKQLRYLNLSSVNFNGRIPGEFGNLTRLHVLDLSNEFFGHLEVDDDIQWISRLPSLQQLDMSGVNLSHASSNLFQVLGMLPSLSWLSLSSCSLKNSHLWSRSPPLNFTFLGNIQYLDLSQNSFQGPIPLFLQNMTSLTFLYLSNNYLSGSISDSIGQFSKLESLDLSDNQLNGSIPDSIGQLYKLETLYLFGNQLSGSIPDNIGQLSNLKTLYLSTNQLSGGIPNSIGQLFKLESIDISNNQLNGVIPESIGKLSNLEILCVQYNSLEGVISEAHFANLSKLIQLDIGLNNLNCEMKSNWRPSFNLIYISMYSCKLGTRFPEWLQFQKTITMVDLSETNISGPLPENIGHMMPELQELYLTNNRLNDSIPRSLCNSKSLGILDLSKNMFSGNIPKSLCNSEALAILDLSSNMLSGSIPNCWRNDQAFYFMDLSSNNLSGLFPSTIRQLSFLHALYLSNNSLHGELHVLLKNFSSLTVLDLGENKFSGNLTWIRVCEIGHHSLKVLRLRKNLFSGYIPLELCSLSQLQILDLADNNLTGKILPCFGKFPTMVNATHLNPDNDSDYFLFWTHLMAVVKGRNLEYGKKTLGLQISIDLSGNNLVGSIPEELVLLKGLHNLNLSWNHLSGEIPKNIGQMENLESLDLSQNELSGTIPNSMSSLTKLSHLNLSYNYLSGPIPTSNQLQTLEDPTIYAGNPQLCGAQLPKKCSNDSLPPTTANSKDGNKDAFEKMWFYIFLMLGFATGFWGVVGTLIFMKSWRYAYFQWVDYVKDWIFVVMTLKVARFKKMFSGNLDDQ
ncbi:hypothetical protein SLA2020_164530 [Shorea laevis]